MPSLQTPSRIFLVGYARAYRLELTDAFRDAGYEVLTFVDPALAAMALDYHAPDAVVMNWFGGAPMASLQFVEQYGSVVPTLIHTSHDVLMDVVKSLRTGAVDYVRAPCLFPELLARLERPQITNTSGQVIEVGTVSLNALAGVLQIKDERVELTDREARILAALLKCPERPVSRENLMRVAGITQAKPTIIESYVKQLRQKHPLLKCSLNTKYGQGYVFVEKY